MKRMAELVELFDRLHEFQAERRAGQRRLFEQGLRQINAQLPLLREQAKVYEAKISPRFNVYRILRLERKEVVVHTPMLANLLDPAGTHGQGFLFLKSFLMLLERHHDLKSPSADPERHQWSVRPEWVTGTHGNLDIRLTCVGLGCVMVIENKIGAGERPEQIH